MSKQPARTPLPLALADCHTPLVAEPLSADQAERLAPSFKALGDPIRLRLLSLIASFEGGEACVCDLTDTFDVSAPTISHHLKVLREIGLVSSERRGTWVYYRAEQPALDLLSTILSVPQQAGA
ncbi:metalloregulator ArsR/SmtB family transcription factor [Glycomyces endophyticus]|uniref:Metalloregulator ArsR/SmtB family transcription factor n=1 Tax=Glycomyces endophyticus TaxID=480996 RepID=A0ABN2HAN2_9ACTN